MLMEIAAFTKPGIRTRIEKNRKMNSDEQGESTSRNENKGNNKTTEEVSNSKTDSETAAGSSNSNKANSLVESNNNHSGRCNCSGNKHVSPIDLLISAADRTLEIDIPLETFNLRSSDEETGAARQVGAVADGNVDTPAELEDYYLLRWQAGQIAKSFVDNTINKVLEQWRSSVNAADFGLGYCDDELIEDEGILMAIQSHGLRQESTRRLPIPAILDGLLDSSTEDLTSLGENNSNFTSEYCHQGTSSDRIDDTDFLNTAVSVAISSKGLASCSYE